MIRSETQLGTGLLSPSNKIIKPVKFGFQNLTIYSQFSIFTSLYDIGNYAVTKLLMSQKIGHCLFTNDVMPAKKTY